MPDSNDHALLDPELVDQLEDTPHEEQIIAGYVNDGSSDNAKVDLAKTFFPAKDEWKGKTVINHQQAKDLAVARNLADIFPDLQDIDPIMQSILDDYEQYLTSVEGKGREELAQILRASFGDQSLGENSEQQSVTIFHGEDNED